MDYVTREEIDRANGIDLLTYLRTCEPDSLVRISRDTYCTSEHDSLKISNGKWYWFSRGIGGVNALKYLIVVQNYTLPQAVRMILGSDHALTRDIPLQSETGRDLKLPPRNADSFRAVRYLKGRGIHPDIIRYCIDKELIYESADRHHNVVFLGYDDSGKASYAGLRAVSGNFRIDARGSDKSWPFSISSDEGGRHLHVFEAAIDLLSYASLERMSGRDWRRDHMLSLAGVSGQKEEGAVPPAIEKYLSRSPEIDTVHLHLDRDEAGRAASRSISRALRERCAVVDEPPLRGKDYNDYLMEKLGKGQRNGKELVR